MTLVVWSFKSKSFSLMGSCSMMSCCSTSSPCWPAWSAWWQCSLCLPAAPASTSRPSPSSQTQRKQTLLRHLSHNGGRVNIGKRGLYAGDRKFDQFQISWPPFTTCLLQPDIKHRRVCFVSSGGIFRKITFPGFTCSGSLYFTGKKKVPRQLVALCLVRGGVHNTCVFLPDQTDVSGCKAVAGDVVLHLAGK